MLSNPVDALNLKISIERNTITTGAASMTVTELSERFRIPSEMLEVAGVRSVTDAEARETLGINGQRDADLAGLLFPYLSPITTERVGGRIRLDHPLPDNSGKYISEPGCHHLFFPPNVGNFLLDVRVSAVIVEAEKSALALRALGDRTGRQMLPIAIGGCWGWRRKIGKRALPEGGSEPETGPSPDFDVIVWQGRSAILAFDCNALTNPKVKQARRALAKELSKRGARVLIAEVPAVEGVNGPDDLIAFAGDEAALSMLNTALAADKEERESAATKLLRLAAGYAELFHAGDSCYATITIAEHRETHALNSRGFRRWLMKIFFEQYGRAATGETIKSSITTLEGIACFDCNERAVFVRLAEYDGKTYLDLCNETWQVVEIGLQGWRVIESKDCPVRFRRAHGMLALPAPERGGTIGKLRQFLNLTSKDDFVLVASWLLGAFHPSGPYPILILHGEQGSAKSTTATVLRNLIDPNLAPRRTEPREPRDMMIAANNGFICSFDNMSRLESWLSDGLCRLSTGGGFGIRTLYTDDDETIFEAKRPIILNGIEELATRGDLLDRSVILYLPRVPDENRRDESEFWKTFRAAQSRLLGALLDAVSVALRNLGSVKLCRLPRMADFAVWVAAAEPALGWEPGTFLRVYAENSEAANDLPLETPVADAIRRLVLPWAGTATQLLAELDSVVDERTRRLKSWPASGRLLSNGLRRLVPNLRKVGVSIRFCRDTSHARSRIINITSESKGGPSSEVSEASNSHIPLDDSSDLTRGPQSNVSGLSSGISGSVDDADDEKHLFPESVCEEPL
jgi:hypothetical protein